ncbi:hypothetical protein RND71_025563 [Anisodus tanguticus]|uniref:Uncharacterized protein n=1 Tax=Anisodus tanguticus TaxID=243964 RepID=A0AAE1RSI0_9SOLA|nr:hypothetical protein RND71_025563 [Anisodus tanguticus]
MLILNLCRYDLVLGELWMKTLDPVTMDFSKLTMSFNYQGKHHVLKGVDEQCKLASSKAVNKLPGNEVELFLLQLIPKACSTQVMGCFNSLNMAADAQIPQELD